MTYKKLKKLPLCLFVILVISFSINLFPKSNNDNAPEKVVVTDPSFVDEVVVHGEAVEKTATVHLVTAAELKEKEVKTIAQALGTVPGLHVRVGGKGEAYVRMRGFTQRSVALLVDGVPISSPYDGQLDLSSLSLDAVDRIEVVKGASSVLYGSNAMGGVINIITRKGDGNNHVSLRSEYGTGSSTNVSAMAQGAMGKLRLLFTGAYFNQERYPLADGYEAQLNQETGDRFNSDRQGWNGQLNLGWDMGPKTQATLSFRNNSVEKGLPHHESDKKAKFWRFTDWHEGSLDLLLKKSYTNASVKAKAYYQYFRNQLDGYDDISYSTQDGKYAFSSRYKDYAVGGDVFFRYFGSQNILLKSALRFRHDVHREQGDVGEDWGKYKLDLLSIPLEAEWKALKHVTVTCGTSVDLMMFDKISEDDKNTTTAFNPMLALLVTPTEKLEFKVSAARKTRFPTMKELFSSTSGNPDLKPMKSNGFELGGEYRPSHRLSFSLVGFYNDVQDLINRDKKDDPYINIDEAVFKGFEAGIEWQVLESSHLSLAYTRLTAVDKTTKDQSYINYRPKHKIDSNLMVRLPAAFKLNINCTYVSSQIYYDDDDVEQNLDPYTLVDIKISKALGRRFELYLAARNIFDVDYYESEGYPREGRMIYAGFRFDVL